MKGTCSIHYFDKTDSNRKKMQHGEIVIVSETDRANQNTRAAIELAWNPWVQKARSLSDLDDDEWKQMICLETSNVSDLAVVLAPGQQHTMKAIVRVADS